MHNIHVVFNSSLPFLIGIWILGCGQHNEKQDADESSATATMSRRGNVEDARDLVDQTETAAPKLTLLDWCIAQPKSAVAEESLLNSDADLIDISGNPLSDSLRAALLAKSDLKWLRVGADLRPTDLDWIGHLRGLKGLCFTGTDLVNSELEFLATLNDLRWLAFVRSPLPTGEFVALAGCPRLQEIHFFGRYYNDNTIRSIAHVQQIRRISLSGSHITDAGVQNLVNEHPALTYIGLFLCRDITPRVFESLGRLSTLEKLAIGSSGAVPTIQVTGELKQFMMAHPRCNVDYAD